jgi:hypothetical protein
MHEDRLRRILDDVKIFDRTFKITPVTVLDHGEASFGMHLQVCYDEPDILTGKIERQESRPWFISETAGESEVVDTVFACVMRSYDHVVKEHFTYKGKRVFSPHFTIAQRLKMAEDV